MGKLDGQVAFITGAARGQGRSHAVRLAQAGADIIAVDICVQIPSVQYPLATPEELEQTVSEVEAAGRRIVARQVDVRDAAALGRAFEDGVGELGAVSLVVANAGIGPMVPEPGERDWDDIIGVNLSGVYNTVRCAIPSMIERGDGGAIVITSSTAAFIGSPTNEPAMLAYTAAKHGVIGLVKAWANYLAPHSIRVNSVAPTGVRTPMIVNDLATAVMERAPDLARAMANALPIDMVEPDDISNAVVFLLSDDAKYVTGTVLPVDAGAINHR